MTREEIIRGMNWLPSSEQTMSEIIDRIERIVRAAERAEREACAKVCEEVGAIADGLTPKDCADAIRARGEK